MGFSRRYNIIVNPAAGHGKPLDKLQLLQYYLNNAGLDYKISFTHAPMEAAEIANRGSHQGFDVVVAFGGDGTLNEVANGLIGENIPLGIIPCGTGNDFAVSAGIPLDLRQAVRILANHQITTIDAGLLDGRYFINAVGVGFDALVNYKSTQMTRLKGKSRYITSLISGLFEYNPIEMEVQFNGTVKTGKTYLVALGNGFSVGGGFRLTPDAQLDDASFDVCHVEDVSIGTILRHFPKLLNGKIGQVKQVTLEKSPGLQITSDSALPIHLDGEVAALNTKEIRVEIIPAALPVIGNWQSVSAVQ